MEEMMAKLMVRMMAQGLERLQKLEVGKYKQLAKEETKIEDDFLFDNEDKDDYYKKKESKTKKQESEVKKKAKGKEVHDITTKMEKIKNIRRRSQGVEEYTLDMDELCPLPNVQCHLSSKCPRWICLMALVTPVIIKAICFINETYGAFQGADCALFSKDPCW